jgi:hypothetical protein
MNFAVNVARHLLIPPQKNIRKQTYQAFGFHTQASSYLLVL